MNSTILDSKANPITVDGDDSRNLAIIYGSLGTLIAFASLIVAVLTWLRSRQQRLAAQHRAHGNIDLESNASSPPRRAEGCLNNTSASDNNKRATTPKLAAVHTLEHRPSFGLDGISILPSHDCESRQDTNPRNERGPSAIEQVSSPSISDKRPTMPGSAAVHYLRASNSFRTR